MLSIAKMRPGSERYYLETVARGLEEYYSGAGESPGVWFGSGCRDLDLTGEVSAEQLSAVLAGVSPSGGSALISSSVPEAKQVSGYDLTFSAPKSVSVLYGLAGEELAAAVRRAHHQALSDALGYLEHHACLARRGEGGRVRIWATGMVAAGYTHRTSRAGDPQLHTGIGDSPH